MSKKVSRKTTNDHKTLFHELLESNSNHFEILCPICYSTPILKIIDSSKNLVTYECKCGKKENELKIVYQMLSTNFKCHHCDKIISDSEKIMCCKCKGFICENCIKFHKKKFRSHKTNTLYKCFLHNKNFIGYCINCKDNFCEKCKSNHVFHNNIFLKEIIFSKQKFNDLYKKYELNKINIDKMIKNANEIKERQIENLEKQILELKEVYEKFKENHTLYLNFYEKILGNYSIHHPKLLCYQTIMNIINNFNYKMIPIKQINYCSFEKFKFTFSQNYFKVSFLSPIKNPMKKIANFFLGRINSVVAKSDSELICSTSTNVLVYDFNKKQINLQFSLPNNQYITSITYTKEKKIIVGCYQKILIYEIEENNYKFEKSLNILNQRIKEMYPLINYNYVTVHYYNSFSFVQYEEPYDIHVLNDGNFTSCCEIQKNKRIILFDNDFFISFYDFTTKTIINKVKTIINKRINSMKLYNDNLIFMISYQEIYFFDYLKNQIETIFVNKLFTNKILTLKDKSFLILGNQSIVRISPNNYQIIEKFAYVHYLNYSVSQDFGDNKFFILESRGRINVWKY